MPALKHRDVDKMLRRKFQFTRDEGGDHIYYTFYHNDRKVLETKLSHQARNSDLHSGMVGTIAQQMRLTSKEVQDSVRCCFSREDYISNLERKALI